MRILISFVFVFLVSIQSFAQQKEGWNLVFHDEFDSTKLDYSKWMDEFPWGRHVCSTRDYSYCTAGKNTSFSSGNLIMITKNESVTEKAVWYEQDDKILCDNKPNYRTFSYTTAMLYSKQEFLHGYFEVRCKISKGKGLWPAFWLYGSDADEIDIFEMFGTHKGKLNTNIHYKLPQKSHEKIVNFKNKNIFSAQFNIIAAEWSPDKIIWLFNGDTIAIAEHNFSKPMHIIAGMGVYEKVDKQNKKKAKKVFPATYEIDYIRVYQRKEK